MITKGHRELAAHAESAHANREDEYVAVNIPFPDKTDFEVCTDCKTRFFVVVLEKRTLVRP